MLGSLGHDSSARGVARIYAGTARTFVIDDADAEQAAAIGDETGLKVVVQPTVMRSDDDRRALAASLLALQPNG
jgi:LPPG:FO 2-phospho-L-lactate transferase